MTSDGQAGNDSDFPDTDFLCFDWLMLNLMAAEAILRGAQGSDKSAALNYFNIVRRRAYGGAGGTITEEELDLDINHR